MKTSAKGRWPDYVLLHLLYLVYSWVLIFIKLASQNPTMSASYLLYMLIAVCLLGAYAIFWQKIIKTIELTLAYPQKGVVIFWVMLWSWILWGDKITLFNLVGAGIIIAGIALLVNENG